MADLPDNIFQNWKHSFEEDAGGITVYRPASYNFPRARGRAGLEFRRDGTLIEWSAGPADAPKGLPGRWVSESPTRVRISPQESARPARTLEIVQCDDNILKVKQHPV